MTESRRSTADTFLVCVGPGPSSAGLIDFAENMAARLHARWYAVHVEDPKMLLMPEAGRNRVVDNMRRAERAGAETVTLSGRDAGEEILNFAREHHITEILAGKPRRSLWKSIVSGGPVDRLVRAEGDINVTVVTGGPGKDREAPPTALHRREACLADYGTGFLFLTLATVLCFLMYPYFQLSNLIMVYLLGVMLTATGCGRGPAALISLLSVLAFDFFFVPPRYTLTVEDAQYIVTFIVMFLVALVISQLATRMSRQTEIARLQERQATAMHGLSRQLVSTRGTEDILKVAVRYISEIFTCSAVAMLPDEKGKWNAVAGDVSTVLQQDILEDLDVIRYAHENGRMTGKGTQAFASASILCIPMQAGDTPLGVLALKPDDSECLLPPEQLHLLESLSRQVALALEVERLQAGGGLPHAS